MPIQNMKLFSGTANPELSEQIAQYLAVPLGDATVRRFSDGEIFIEINENVRGRDTFVVQPTSAPANDHLMELLIMVDALRRASADRITAVVPYYGYARQDRKSANRTPITAKLVANILAASGIDRLLTMDLHSGQIQGFFDIPVDHVYATPVMLEAIQKLGHQSLVVVSPDVGGVVRARSYAKRLNADLAIIDKRRPAPNQAEVLNVIGDVDGKACIIVDDMVDTAGTLCTAAEALLRHGAKSVCAACTHGVLSGAAIERIESSALSRLLITNTIRTTEKVKACAKIQVYSVAPILGEVIRRTSNEESVSSLFF